jgi:hypothetical protein
MHRLLALLLLVTIVPLANLAQPALAAPPGNAFFQTTWERTDAVVASTEVSRTWVWGPDAFTGVGGEAYADSPGGTRLVQYFDKSRMEINDPNHATTDLWYVTNGLLARELISGRMQVGDDDFEDRGPAHVNIAGDPDDTEAPTYASFAGRLADPAVAEGSLITTTIDRSGNVACCVPDAWGVTGGPLVPETGHRVASIFWDYLNSGGKIVERGFKTRGALFANPYYATGYPIGEAHWARVRVAEVPQWVLVQPFERRVLTYTPSNAAGWHVEMGNVGRHYYAWRHGNGGLAAAPSWTLPPVPEFVPDGQRVDIPDVEAHYDLHITEANVDSGVVRATEQIRIDRFYSPRPETLYLQVVPAEYGYFTLNSMTLNGAPVTPQVLRDGFTLAVTLPGDAPLPLTIGVDFRLDVGGFPNDFIGTVLDRGILRLGYWFPIISNNHGYSLTMDPSQSPAADFNVTLDVASDVVVAHTGDEVSREELGGGIVRYRLEEQGVRDFALCLSRDFSVTVAGSDDLPGLQVRYYAHPSTEGGLTDEALGFRQEKILAATFDSIRKLNGLVGSYPYSSYTIVDVGPNMPGGLEFPGLIYINGAYSPLDRLIYHETAHQWLYGIIGNRTLADGWIDEGGAEFFERGLPTGFTEVPQVPARGYDYWLDSSSDELPLDPSRQWYYSIYEQGARFYYEVMWSMGDDAFWRAFRDIYDRYAFEIASPYQVLSTFQSHSPTDLRPLYDEYFRYPWVWDLLPNGG